MRLTLFDLDHTLLGGDSDLLWCDFLIARGLLDAAIFATRYADMAARHRAGSAGQRESADFSTGTLAGRSPLEWEPLRQEFLGEWIAPRISPAAIALVDSHLQAGELVVMTTATNRFITELTAIYFDIEHLIATEPEVRAGLFTGTTTGVPNMHAGKVARLHDWLQARGIALKDCKRTTAYSDSIDDLPLLEAIRHPVAVNADSRLAAIASQRGWRSMALGQVVAAPA